VNGGLRSKRERFLAVCLGLFAAGCAQAPEPPAPLEDLSALALSYDHPTARLPGEQVRDFVLAARQYLQISELLTGLRFTRTLISETSAGLGANTAVEDLSISGVVHASVPCFGDEPMRTLDAATNGKLSATLGVQGSRLKRAFDGEFERCVFRVEPALVAPQRVSVSARVVADLGADLGIGDEFTGPLLMKLRDITGESSGGLGDFQLDSGEFHFRLRDDGAIDTLVDGAMFGLGETGSVLLSLRVDGTISLRDSLGEWSCDAEVALCALVK
jgi:hypothetical protein